MDRNLLDRAEAGTAPSASLLPRELPADLTYAEFISLAARDGVHPLDLLGAVCA